MKRVLIVDDEPHIIRIMKLALEREGYEVDIASNGMEGLIKIRLEPPDVLITDIAMPKMTGEELCKQISTEMPDREFLIFVTTSRTEVEHREWSREIDNLLFLEKPVSTRKLMPMLNDYFMNQTHEASRIV